MSISSTVLRNSGVPFLTIASIVLIAFFLIKAVLMPGVSAVFSIFMAIVMALLGVWSYRRGQRANVVIDAETFTVNRGRRSESYRRDDVASVDLSSQYEQIKFHTGKGITLPLEGRPLVEAGILLSPRSGQ